MTEHLKTLARLSYLACMIGWLALPAAVHGQGAPRSVTPLIQQMSGTWRVEPRMWPGPEAKPIQLAPAIARRRIVNDAFLHEEMTAATGSQQDAFTRVAYMSYNEINQQYEYFSLDSRLPQMMSYVLPGANQQRDQQIELQGTSFVAPAWGPEKNVAFIYRLTVGAIEGDRQIVRLYLKQQQTQAREFLAFEYLYIRQR